MKKVIIGLFILTLFTNASFAQNAVAEQEITTLSKQKWQWMADKNIDSLAALFHEKSMFVHMGGSWGKDRKLMLLKEVIFGIKKQKCIQ